MSGPITESVLLGNIAVRSYLLKGNENKDYWSGGSWIGRKKLIWDSQNMIVKNLEEANQFVSRNYRSGWELT